MQLYIVSGFAQFNFQLDRTAREKRPQLFRSSSFEKHTRSADFTRHFRPHAHSQPYQPPAASFATMAPKAATKAAPQHVPYAEMIKSAIVSLKDRTGSSLPALQKKIGELQQQLRSLRNGFFPCCLVTVRLTLVMLTSTTAALSQLA